MAGILANLYTPVEVALAAATAKTVLQIVAPTNQRLKVKRWGIYFDGTSSTNAPVQVSLVKQSTAGSGGTAQTPIMISAGSETLQATGQYGCTSEPTTTAVQDVFEIHPQTGWQEFIPLDQDFPVLGGTRLGIVVTADNIVNCKAKIIYEE